MGHVKIRGQTASAKPTRLERAWHVGESQMPVPVWSDGRWVDSEAREEGWGHDRQGL